MAVGACGFRYSTDGNVAVTNLKFETFDFECFRPGVGSLGSGWRSSSEPHAQHNKQTVRTNPKFHLKVFKIILCI